MLELYLFVAFLVTAGVLGLWQCWAGWRTGKMFAFDPAGATAKLSRQDGCLFTIGWWFTFAASIFAFVLAVGFLMHGPGTG